MNCNCHPEPRRGDVASAASIAPSIVPCDLETLARLQAQYLPKSPPADFPAPSQVTTASKLCRQSHIQLKPGAEAILDDELTPQAFFERLVQADFLADARRVLAHAMPKRRALWWACLCAQEAYQHGTPEPVSRAIKAVVQFVHDPSEFNRREAERIGRTLPPNRLEGCLAMAAFFTTGSVSLPHLPVVHPRPFVTGRLVGVCVYLASVIHSAAHYKQHLRQYLVIGADIARGENLWYDHQRQPVRIDPAATTAVPDRMHIQPAVSGVNLRGRSAGHHQTQERT